MVKQPIILFSLALLCGCMEGPREETLIDELQVVAIQLDNPSPSIGEVVNAEWVISQPEPGTEVSWLAWTCTPLGFNTCAESLAPSWPTLAGSGLQASTSAPIPALPDDFPAGAVSPFTTVNLMACEGCDLGLVNPADPDAFAQTQSFQGFSWASLDIPITDSPRPDTNPTLVAEEQTPDEPQNRSYTFTVSDEEQDIVTVWLYATAGGWDQPAIEVGASGEVSAIYFPPEEDTKATLWAVVTQRDGLGTTWWQGEYTP